MNDKILLVEDNPDDAELTRLALDSLQKGVKVVHVTDGAQAIDYLHGGEARSDVRFVILDIKLPKINGLQVLARLRADARTKTLPVVMLTSSNRDSDVAQSYESGVNGYVVKPVELEDYLARVSALGRYWDDVNQPPPR